MDTSNVVKLVKHKVRETIVREAEEWNKARAEAKEEQKRLAEMQQTRTIGFKW